MTMSPGAFELDQVGRVSRARRTLLRAWLTVPRSLVISLAAAGLAAGCAGDDGPKAAPARDYSGCRTSTQVAAFAREIEAARPLALRMKRGFGAPGLTIAVAVDGRVVWSEVCGYADVKKRRRNPYKKGDAAAADLGYDETDHPRH